MHPSRFSNFTVAIVCVAVVSIAEKITSLIKVGMAGYPPVAPQRATVNLAPSRTSATLDKETPGTDVEETPKS